MSGFWLFAFSISVLHRAILVESTKRQAFGLGVFCGAVPHAKGRLLSKPTFYRRLVDDFTRIKVNDEVSIFSERR